MPRFLPRPFNLALLLGTIYHKCLISFAEASYWGPVVAIELYVLSEDDELEVDGSSGLVRRVSRARDREQAPAGV